MKNLGVIFGGNSVERDVSIITGVMTCNMIENYNVFPIYIDKSGKCFTGSYLLDMDNYKSLDYKKLKQVTLLDGSDVLYQIKRNKLKEICHISGIINCTHGGNGENGNLSGRINLSDICLCSPDNLSSSISMDKKITKLVMKGLNIKTLPYLAVTDFDEIEKDKLPFDFPMIVKPTCGGSSIGINVAKNISDLEKFVNYSLKFGKSAIIEPCLTDFTEINCGAYIDENDNIIVSPCERPVGRTNILTFKDKYETGKREFPADIRESLANKIRKTTKKVYKELNFKGVIRIDYFIINNTVYLNEINSVPGSLGCYLFGKDENDFNKMIDSIVKYSEKEFAKESTYKKDFNSGILLCGGAKGVKHL